MGKINTHKVYVVRDIEIEVDGVMMLNQDAPKEHQITTEYVPKSFGWQCRTALGEQERMEAVESFYTEHVKRINNLEINGVQYTTAQQLLDDKDNIPDDIVNAVIDKPFEESQTLSSELAKNSEGQLPSASTNEEKSTTA